MRINTAQCAAFYKHFVLEGDDVAPCCRWSKNFQKFDGDFSQVLHSKKFVELRKKVESGKKLKECKKCYYEEKLGRSLSLRQKLNMQWRVDSVQVESLELNLNNVCNLACIMCDSHFSSRIWKEENPTLPANQGIWRLKDIPNIPDTVKRIRFMGGEPLMTNVHRQVLRSIKDPSKVEIQYITNGMFMLTPEDVVLLNKCAKVAIYVSIDAYGKLNEEIRIGSDWNQIEKVVDDILNNTNYVLGIETVLHKKSWKGLVDLLLWIEEKRKIRSIIWNVHPLIVPEQLSIKNLNLNESKELMEIVTKYYNIPDSKQIRRMLEL